MTVRVALLTYSTRPRGGVVHTLALAEALAREGADVTVHAVGRGGDQAFFRPVDRAVRVRLAPLADVDGEPVGARVLRSIDALAAARATPAPTTSSTPRTASRPTRCAGVVRTVHHLDQFTTPELAALPRAGDRHAGGPCVRVAGGRRRAGGRVGHRRRP